MISKILLTVFLFYFLARQTSGFYENPNEDSSECKEECISQVFCEGMLLHDVQTSRIFADGTTFVTHSLKYSEEDIVRNYTELRKQHGGTPPPSDILNFVMNHFTNESLYMHNFTDFNNWPAILNKTSNENYTLWLSGLNKLWIDLGRIIPPQVVEHPDQYSYIYVPNPFVIAGGRFKEMYYWDSYWIVKGLLICGMHQTARGIIENIITLVDKYDHMPNGNRIYYKTRSQPPMLIQMAAEYYKYTKNDTFIKNNIETFDKEMQWWLEFRSVDVPVGEGESLKMFRYKSVGCTPRPESYQADYELVKNVTELEKLQILTGLRSAAETGWDFSSRHMRGVNNTNNGTLRDSDPDKMLYVDLNSIMHSNMLIMSEWYAKLGDELFSLGYRAGADLLAFAIDRVLWNDEVGVWLDFDLVANKSRNYFYGSNFTPLWTKSFYNTKYIDKVISYLVSRGMINPANDSSPYFCIPTSTYETKEQWDFPNCWAPLQAFLIQGLHNYRDVNPKAGKIALNLAQRWVDTMYEGYRKDKVMHEKYNAQKFGESGAGGEYTPQTGFGWTNGFCFELFNTWGSELK